MNITVDTHELLPMRSRVEGHHITKSVAWKDVPNTDNIDLNSFDYDNSEENINAETICNIVKDLLKSKNRFIRLLLKKNCFELLFSNTTKKNRNI